MSSIKDAARSDPVGAGLVISAVALAALVAVNFMPPLEMPVVSWPWPDAYRTPRQPPAPLEQPPPSWLANSGPHDVLVVPGHHVAYWGRPDVRYGAAVSSRAVRPVAIVVHYTDNRPILRLVRYQHNGDSERGGSYGYHVYIDEHGRVVQGAPLTVRTNHIKPRGAGERRETAPHLDSANTIGVSLVGACRSPSLLPISYRCRAETITPAQLEAGEAVIRELLTRYKIPCHEVYGHGDLQTDRQSIEGWTLSRRVRGACDDAPIPGSARMEIVANSPMAGAQLERAYAAGLRDMLYIHDSNPRVIARIGAARWLPRENGRPFTGPEFARAFLAAHSEYGP